MDTVEPLRVVLSFGLVIGLIGMFALALRYAAKRYPQWVMMKQPGGGRLQIIETKLLDTRRKLVLIKRDDREHLLLLSPQQELLIESIPHETREN